MISDVIITSEIKKVRNCLSGIEALEFSCVYTCIKPAAAGIFPVVANTRPKSVQKQIKSIDVNKVGSKTFSK